jgi:hypothetical protein
MGLLAKFVAPFVAVWRQVMTPPAMPSTDSELEATERAIDDDVLETCGKLAVAELVKLWQLDIYDPRHNDHSAAAVRNRAIILDIIREGGGWDWIDEYRGDGAKDNPQWCGFTAAMGWRSWIAVEVRRTWWASCYRLDAWASYRDLKVGNRTYANPKPKSGPLRLCAKLDATSTRLPFEPRPGDILVVGNGDPSYGDHICVVRGWDPARRMFLTVEGNGQGVGPDGKRQHGLVFAERPLGKMEGHAYIAMRLIRPAVTDLLP